MAFLISIFLIAFAFLAIFAVVYIVFMFWCASKFKIQIDTDQGNAHPEGVSILIPFRNEAVHLDKCLNSLVNQLGVSFPFEIVLIDDASDDNSRAVVQPFIQQLPIHLIYSQGVGKKDALQTGISVAKYNVIYTLDADCVLKPKTLQYMGSRFVSENLNMLCGLVNLTPARGVFQSLQAAESAALVGISAVMLNAQKPATCNGANLMFRKDVFLQLKGYENYKHLSSGDDDFLMHAFFNFNASACQYAIHPDAVVETAAEETLSKFFNQRARWASKRKHYLFPYNKYLYLLMGLKFLTYWAILKFLIVSYFFSGDSTSGILFLSLYISELVFANRLRRVLKLNYLSILLLPLYQFYLPLVLLYGKFFQIKWKGRRIHAS